MVKKIRNSGPVILDDERGIGMDIHSKLLHDRIIFLNGEIDEYLAEHVKTQLLYLESLDSKKDIKLLINSGGGEIFSGFSIIDTMEYIRPEIITINTGLAASMAAVILCCGTKGKRKSLKRARTMIHQPLSSVMGQCSDIQIEAREIQIIKEELCQIIADRTGQKYSKVYNDCERDYWMDSTKTLDYGLIDSIVKPRK